MQAKNFTHSRMVESLKYSRRIAAVFVFVVVVSSVAVFAYWSYKEDPIQGLDQQQWSLRPVNGHYHGGKSYRVELESIDEAAGTARLRADLHVPSGHDLMFSLTQNSPGEFIPREFKRLSFGPLVISDVQGEDLLIPDGFAQRLEFYRNAFARRLEFLQKSGRSEPLAELSETQPVSAHGDVDLLGEPWWYPFDQYFLAAKVDCDVIGTDYKQRKFPLADNGYYLSPQIPPNLIIRMATKEDVAREAAKSFVDRDNSPVKVKESFNPDLWRYGVVVLILKRPIFPKFFAIFFGIVAIVWIAVIAMSSDSKQLTLNVVGYFLAVWAIRAPLAIGAPKTTTLMDYVTLGLYALLIGVAAFKFLWGYKKPEASINL